MKKLVAAALLLAVVAPRTSSAGSAYRTFTDRAAYLAALVNTGSTSFNPTPANGSSSVGPISLTTSGACALPPSVFGGVIAFASQDDGSGQSCAAGAPATLIFNTRGLSVVGFGVDLGAPAGDVNVSAAALFDNNSFSPSSGNNPQTYTLLTSAPAQSFFGVVLDVLPGGPFEISAVSVSVTSRGGIVGLDDVTYGAFAQASTVPEPATLLLLGGGLAVIGGVAARRRRSV